MKFRRVKRESPSPEPQPGVWIAPAEKAQAEEHLFYFLRSLRQGRPQAAWPLLLEPAVLRALYAEPHPDLTEALHQCLYGFLVELDPDPACWGEFTLSPAIWGVALATYNCFLPASPSGDGATDPLTEFTAALLDTLPPARNLTDALAYHALLHQAAEALPHLPTERAVIMHGLLNRSPLSAVYHLHYPTPPPLTRLAADLLRHWRRRVADPAPWSGTEDWLDALEPLLAQPAIAVYLRRRWLALPETRPACRNLGLLLEALRRRGNQRAFILDFYEAYDYLHGETRENRRGRPYRCWPILDRVERLLHASGGSEESLEAAIRLNRRGNEYLLKFHALIQIIAEEGRVPTDYNHLHPGWIPALRPLLDFTTEGVGPRPNLEAIEYTGEGEE